MSNKELTSHIAERIDGEGYSSKHVDWEKNGFVFNTYTRNSDGGDIDRCNTYIDVCAISITPVDHVRYDRDNVKRIHQHEAMEDVDEYISLLENWATTMDRELRFTEFGEDFAEIQYFVDRGYQLRYPRGQQRGKPMAPEEIINYKPVPGPLDPEIQSLKFWYVEAYKSFIKEPEHESMAPCTDVSEEVRRQA